MVSNPGWVGRAQFVVGDPIDGKPRVPRYCPGKSAKTKARWCPRKNAKKKAACKCAVLVVGKRNSLESFYFDTKDCTFARLIVPPFWRRVQDDTDKQVSKRSGRKKYCMIKTMGTTVTHRRLRHGLPPYPPQSMLKAEIPTPHPDGINIAYQH